LTRRARCRASPSTSLGSRRPGPAPEGLSVGGWFALPAWVDDQPTFSDQPPSVLTSEPVGVAAGRVHPGCPERSGHVAVRPYGPDSRTDSGDVEGGTMRYPNFCCGRHGGPRPGDDCGVTRPGLQAPNVTLASLTRVED